ncbi:CLUMA_CG017334, isoform A [Clunio marinus]|uniref:CLUMA_CG017334, isoform A n=1 Tax=Clunio marinus TaxID=568069 RepID=A0A1J1IVN1_9DIPT|nr:CLUMA_CG017334, isoform A [Clunio marinus]
MKCKRSNGLQQGQFSCGFNLGYPTVRSTYPLELQLLLLLLLIKSIFNSFFFLSVISGNVDKLRDFNSQMNLAVQLQKE